MKRPLLMIPGPVEVDEEVLAALARPPIGHTSPAFLELFGACLDDLRAVFAAPDGQPFVVAGSGTFAMELAAANLTQPGTRALVIDTGYFSQRMAEILRRHGAQVEVVPTDLGGMPDLAAVEAALQRGVDIMSITHVDTSTGVLAPVQALAALANRYQALVLVDGVCAVGGQEFRMAEWGVDVALTASQKALAVPPGLALVMARPAALARFAARTLPVASYYADWTQWLPVMQAYQARRPAYFGTPPVNLIAALAHSVRHICAEGMEVRWARHRRVSQAFKAGAQALGLRQVACTPQAQADTLTTLYYPDGTDAALLGRIAAAGVIVAGGLFPSIAARTFRVGHMGVDGLAEVLLTLAAIEQGLGVTDARAVCAARRQWASDKNS